jgi:hypothetical protein
MMMKDQIPRMCELVNRQGLTLACVHIIEASNQSGELLRCSAYFNHPHASEWNWSGWQDWKSGGGQTNKGQLSIPNSKHLGGSHMIRCILPPKDETLTGDEGVSRIGSYESGRDK